MDSIKNSANFELSFIYFYEQYAWFTAADLGALLSRTFRLLLRPQILKSARMHEIVIMEY